MTRTTYFAALITIPLLLAGCGSAHLVHADPRGGELALDGAYSRRAEQARVIMATHCDGPYAITSAEEGGDRLYPAPDQQRVTFVCTPARGAHAQLDVVGKRR